MIEIIGKETGTNEMSVSYQENIRLPKNIKQIGDVSGEKRIYIEDYAYSFVKSLKKPAFGILMGRIAHNQSAEYCFVRGAVLSEVNDSYSGYRFDEKIWGELYSQIDKFFPDMEIVGWFNIIDGMGEQELARLTKTHIDNFSGRMKSLFLINLNEEEEHFYLIEDSGLLKQPGYCRFYEKNVSMQEYIISVRGQVSCEQPENESVIRNFRELVNQTKASVSNSGFFDKKPAASSVVSVVMAVALVIAGFTILGNYSKMKSLSNALETMVNDGKQSARVVEVAGNVYPTQPETKAVEQSQTETQAIAQIQTQPETEAQSQTDEAASVSAQPATVYVVKSGDSLAGICRKQYGSLERLDEVVKLNDLENANKIYIGQEIKLP